MPDTKHAGIACVSVGKPLWSGVQIYGATVLPVVDVQERWHKKELDPSTPIGKLENTKTLTDIFGCLSQEERAS